MAELKSHPAADAFPLMVGEEFDALCADIQEHGQREPIVLYDGQIIDGRNRNRACLRLGIEPKFREWETGMSPEAFVVSANIMRRHLTPSQRAMLVARLVNVEVGFNNAKNIELVNTNSIMNTGKAAEIGGVHPSQVSTARRILKHGNPEQIADADSGKRGVKAVADQISAGRTDKDEQKRRVAGDKQRKETRAKMTLYWRQLKDGMEALGTLPDIETVVNSVPASQREFVDKRLIATTEWLAEFQEKWNARSERNSNA